MGVRIFSFILGILSILYFCIYAVMAGLTNKFTYFWLLLGIFGILLAGSWPHLKAGIKAVPLPIKAVVAAVIGISILTLIIAEGFVIGYGAAAPAPGADYVIVLGAQVRGRSPSYNLARRLDAAYDYLKENTETQAILSGGMGEGEEISEARAMQSYLEEKGLPRERMILEDKSTNTYENLKYSREKMKKQDAEVILVTSDFHVFRSIQIAKKQGIEHVEGLGAPGMWYTVPNLYLREAFAVVKYALCGQI